MSKSKKEKKEIDEIPTPMQEYMKSVELKENNPKDGDVLRNRDKIQSMKILYGRCDRNFYRTVEDSNENTTKAVDNFFKRKATERAKAFLALPRYYFNSYCMHFASSSYLKETCVFTISSPSTTHANSTGGFMDTRLGPLRQNELCATCCKDYRGCDGHKAWIEFPEKIPNPLAEKDYFNTIKCICWCCEEPFADKEFIEIMGLKKFSNEKYRDELAKYSSKLRDVHKHGGYIHEDFTSMIENRVYYTKKSGDKKFSTIVKDVNIIHSVFSKLTEEQREILGFYGETKPQNYLMDGIVVIPPKLRRPGYVNGVATTSSITDKYLAIFGHANQAKTSENNPQDKMRHMACVYEKVRELLCKTKKTYKKTDKGIIEILSKKDGRIRRYGMGKRPDGSCRAVVGSITGVDIDQFGIPKIACKKLLKPTKVHKYNLKKIVGEIEAELYKEATIIKDGVERVIKLDGKVKFVPVRGNTVWRCLRNNDMVLHGRQPTLHAESLLASRVKEVDGITCGLHEAVTGAMNCDFDGDENSWHVVSNTDALIELMTCSSVVQHVPNLEANKPMMAPAFHALLMAYEASEKWVYPSETGIVRKEGEAEIDVLKRIKKAMIELSDKGHELTIPERRFPELLCRIKQSHRTKSYIKRCEKNGVNYLTGRALMSLAFPTNLNFTSGDLKNPSGYLKISDGILVNGVLKSSNISKGNGSIVQVIYKLYSSNEAARFISDFTKITDWLTMYQRFSIGQQSFSTNREEIKRTLEPELNRLQSQIYALGPKPNNSFDEFHWKRELHSIADQNLVFAKNVGNSYFLPNNGLNMLSGNGSGGKGSDMNTSQITAFLGLQKIKGDFQKKEFNDGTRLLPTFIPGDCSLESSGFIVNSFYDGLSPSQCFAHLCASREGLIATAIQVSEVGTVRRDIEKSTENNIVDYQGYIASKLGKIYSFTSPIASPAMAVSVENSRTGKILSFCDFKTHADFVNGQYEFIEKYLNQGEKSGNTEEKVGDVDEKTEEDEVELYQINEDYANDEIYNDDDNGYDAPDYNDDGD